MAKFKVGDKIKTIVFDKPGQITAVYENGAGYTISVGSIHYQFNARDIASMFPYPGIWSAKKFNSKDIAITFEEKLAQFQAGKVALHTPTQQIFDNLMSILSKIGVYPILDKYIWNCHKEKTAVDFYAQTMIGYAEAEWYKNRWADFSVIKLTDADFAEIPVERNSVETPGEDEPAESLTVAKAIDRLKVIDKPLQLAELKYLNMLWDKYGGKDIDIANISNALKNEHDNLLAREVK